MKKFNAPYLAGFISEKYNYTDREMFPRIQSRISNYMDTYMHNSIRGYSSVNFVNRNYNIRQLKAEYALFPVWMVYYDYDHSEYTFAMNGQTGKFVGDLPMDKSLRNKYFLLSSGIAAAVVMLVQFLLWMI